MPQEETGTASCPECGALYPGGMNCRQMLASVLGWEGKDPELAALHYQIVASFNLQHPGQLTDEAHTALRDSFVGYLAGELTPAEIRRQMAAAFEGRKRVLRQPGEWNPVLRQWPMTIADVFVKGRGVGAVDRVGHWAEVVRQGA
ncbi:MAG TPA: DUF5946 family protein [Anaerolineales bacterium]